MALSYSEESSMAWRSCVEIMSWSNKNLFSTTARCTMIPRRILEKNSSQIPPSNHPPASSSLPAFHSRKRPRTREDKVVFVSNFTQCLDRLEHRHAARAIACERLDGSTRNRQQKVDSFNREEFMGNFLLSSKAGGVGLNLIGAGKLCMVDPDWNPACDAQAMRRVYRDGQRSEEVFIFRLICAGTIEECVLRRQLGKADLSDNLLANGSVSHKVAGLTPEAASEMFGLKGYGGGYEDGGSESSSSGAGGSGAAAAEFVASEFVEEFCCGVDEEVIKRSGLPDGLMVGLGLTGIEGSDDHAAGAEGDPAEGEDDDIEE